VVADASDDTTSVVDAAPDTGTVDAGPTCPAGIPSPYVGCAVLSAPLSGASGQHAHFSVQLANETDLTGATITAVIAGANATAGVVQPYIQHNSTLPDGGSVNYSEQFLGWKNWSSGWTTITGTVSSSGYDPTGIQWYGLSLENGSATDAAAFEQPETVIYVAAITITAADSSTITSIVFDSSSKVTSATFQAAKLWLNTSDTTTAFNPVDGGAGPYASATWLPAN
jgi:hypothetical protein